MIKLDFLKSYLFESSGIIVKSAGSDSYSGRI